MIIFVTYLPRFFSLALWSEEVGPVLGYELAHVGFPVVISLINISYRQKFSFLPYPGRKIALQKKPRWRSV